MLRSHRKIRCVRMEVKRSPGTWGGGDQEVQLHTLSALATSRGRFTLQPTLQSKHGGDSRRAVCLKTVPPPFSVLIWSFERRPEPQVSTQLDLDIKHIDQSFPRLRDHPVLYRSRSQPSSTL